MNHYSTPANTRLYAIGDIHGHLDALDRMHEAIFQDLLDDPAPDHVEIIYMGDYIDRGAENKGVIERLIERRDRGDGVPKTFLKGNHEIAMLDFMSDPLDSSAWLKWGGLETLDSYGIKLNLEAVLPGEIEKAAKSLAQALPDAHAKFLESTQLFYQSGDYLFVHAGIHPLKSFEHQTEPDFTNIRKPFLDWHKDPLYRPLPYKVVHGHSIEAEPQNLPHRVGLDTGYYKTGVLTCGVFEGSDIRFLQVRN